MCPFKIFKPILWKLGDPIPANAHRHTYRYAYAYIYITIHQQKCYLIRQNSDTIACSRHDKMKKTNTLG